MKGTISVSGHDLTYSRSEYEDFNERGRSIAQLGGRGSYRCSCGAKGAGVVGEIAAKIREHLGIEDSDQPSPD